MTSIVKVQFYGYMPEGEEIKDVIPEKVVQALFSVFPFQYIDDLVITQEKRDDP